MTLPADPCVFIVDRWFVIPNPAVQEAYPMPAEQENP